MSTAAYSTTRTQTINLCGILSESKRIINAHSRHFLALSVLFLLPLSFSLLIYPTLQSILSDPDSLNHHQTLLFFAYASPPPEQPQTLLLLLPLLYLVCTTLLSLLAISTITYSTFHGFYGRPVKLVSSLKSTLYSFLPLTATLIISQFVTFLITALITLFFACNYKVLVHLGLDVDRRSSISFGIFATLMAITLVLVLLYLQVKWSLVPVIVVVESKWGYTPLKRSAYLVKGMRGVALSMVLFYGFTIGFIIWGSSTTLGYVGGGLFEGWRSWGFILQIVCGSGLVTLLMLQSVAANTVLYMYCKALKGELAFEIVEEFARDYVSLPFDDEKVPHVVSVGYV